MDLSEWKKAIKDKRLSYEWAPLRYDRFGQKVELEIIADCVKAYSTRHSCSAESMQHIADAIGGYIPTALIHEMKWRKSFQVLPLTRPATFSEQVSWSGHISNLLAAYGVGAKELVSGYYKTWVLDKLCISGGHSGSAPVPRGINHGFMLSAVSVDKIGASQTWRGIPVDDALVGGEYTKLIQRLGTRHGIKHGDYSQIPSDFIRNVRVDGRPVDVPLFYSMFDCATHDGKPLGFSRQPGVPAITEPEPLPAASSNLFSTNLLEFAQYELKLRVHEDLGPNDGTRIREYAKLYGLTPPLNWCGVGVGFWIRKTAYNMGIRAPVEGSPAAQGIIPQLKAIGAWIPAKDARADHSKIIPGSVVVWKRPPETWTGHVGVVENNDFLIKTIEPNSGAKANCVATMYRKWDDPNLLGFGVFDKILPVEPVVNGKDPLM